jgi:maltose/moltooligosaccharide transporter
MRLAWGRTFLLGTGFMAISTIVTIYDSYMPKFYEGYLSSSFLVGAVMGIDNFLGMTLQPWAGSLSDRTTTRWGRRRPFILLGMPIAALAAFLLPLGRERGLLPLLAITVILNLALAWFRAPLISLMPDLTPQELRSPANGVINLMGGGGTVIVLMLGSRLFALSPRYPFWLSASILALIALVFLIWIREPATPAPAEPDEAHPSALLPALGLLFRRPRAMGLPLFLAIASWFVGYQSVNTWFTLWSEQRLHVLVNVASGRLAVMGATFILMAIPAGLLGVRLGRRRTIAIGLAGMTASLLFMHTITSLQVMTVALAVTGLFWALVNINSYPLVVSICRDRQTGTYTGLYYLFSGLAGTLGPALAGRLFDLTGSKQPLFPMAATAMGIALLLVLLWREDPA